MSRLLTCGERAVLIELDDLDAVLAADRELSSARCDSAGPWGCIVDTVPAARTLLVVVRAPADLAGVRSNLPGLLAQVGSHGQEPDPTVVELPVRYDGPDLDEVARLTGLTPDEIVAAHTGTPWRVGFGGFAPGFAYLTGGDPRLEVPRRDEPRTKVPPGAVGLAGAYSGVYPRSSPGGWQLIGTTQETLWDVDRDPPALLQPGFLVRFVEAGTR